MSGVLVGALTDLPEDVGTCVDVDGTAVAVFRSDHEVFALQDRCSHAEASLCEGEVFDGEVECPRHGALFDVTTGAAKTLPAVRGVSSYATRTVDGFVEVEVPA